MNSLVSLAKLLKCYFKIIVFKKLKQHPHINNLPALKVIVHPKRKILSSYNYDILSSIFFMIIYYICESTPNNANK